MQTSPVKNGDENDLESEASSWGWGRDALKTAPMETEKGYYGATLEDGARPIRIEWNYQSFRCLPFWGLTLLVIYFYYRRLEKSLAAESPGALERARIVHADAAVGLACPAYDDDAFYDAKCPAADAKSWCAASVTSAGTPFAALCPTACDDEDAAWAMPCAWMAVKSLPAACAGAFAPSLEGLASANAAATGDEPNPLTLGGDARLYGCDEHAVCFSCYNGNNPGATADARYCEAVAAYYGGFGVPFATDEDVWSLRAVAGAGKIGANAAWRAINDDWAFWCDAETLAAIDQGTFADRYLQRRG